MGPHQHDSNKGTCWVWKLKVPLGMRRVRRNQEDKARGTIGKFSAGVLRVTQKTQRTKSSQFLDRNRVRHNDHRPTMALSGHPPLSNENDHPSKQSALTPDPSSSSQRAAFASHDWSGHLVSNFSSSFFSLSLWLASCHVQRRKSSCRWRNAK